MRVVAGATIGVLSLLVALFIAQPAAQADSIDCQGNGNGYGCVYINTGSPDKAEACDTEYNGLYVRIVYHLKGDGPSEVKIVRDNNGADSGCGERWHPRRITGYKVCEGGNCSPWVKV